MGGSDQHQWFFFQFSFVWQMKILKNRTKLGIPHCLVLVWNCTKPGTAQIETVLNGDPLYFCHVCTVIQWNKNVLCFNSDFDCQSTLILYSTIQKIRHLLCLSKFHRILNNLQYCFSCRKVTESFQLQKSMSLRLATIENQVQRKNRLLTKISFKKQQRNIYLKILYHNL